RYRHAVASTAAGGLSVRPACGSRGSCGLLDQAQAARMDGRGYLCRLAGHYGHTGTAGVRAAAGIPHPCGPRGDNLAGGPGVPQGGPGRALPGAVACGTGSPLDQTDDADGRAAVQNASHGAEGDLGPPAGLQPAPGGHGPSRPGARGDATPGELARDAPDAGSLSQPVGADAFNRTGESSPYCSSWDRQSPCGNPAGPLRAARVQATPEAVSPPEGTAAASPRTL